MQAFMNMLSPDYFKTMGIPVLDGRDFRRGEAQKEPTADAPLCRRRWW